MAKARAFFIQGLFAASLLDALVACRPTEKAAIVLNVDTAPDVNRQAITSLLVTVNGRAQSYPITTTAAWSLGIFTSAGSKAIVVEGMAGTATIARSNQQEVIAFSGRSVTVNVTLVAKDVGSGLDGGVDGPMATGGFDASTGGGGRTGGTTGAGGSRGGAGGLTEVGGSSGDAGRMATTGGIFGIGGVSATGGTQSGGNASDGGTMATGGSSTTAGGSLTTGGSAGSGGASAFAGATGTGGMAGTGGSTVTGGSTGGSGGTGGAGGDGGNRDAGTRDAGLGGDAEVRLDGGPDSPFDAAVDLPAGDVARSDGNSPSVYAAFNEKRNWADAQQACKLRGGGLAAIHTRAQNEAAYQVCATTIGGNGPDLGCWLGAQVPFASWDDATSFDYTNWASGQPDGNGTCLWLYIYSRSALAGQWDDWTCAWETSYVCTLPPGADLSGATTVTAVP